MKSVTRSVLGSAIAALLVTPVFAGVNVDAVRPPLLAAKGAAAELAQPSDRIIVKFRDITLPAAQRAGALARAAASMGVEAKAGRRLAVDADVVRLSRKLDRVEMDAFLGQLRADPSVEYAIVDAIMKPLYTPNDPFYATHQWHYNDLVGGLSLPSAWDIAKGSGVVVAVLDTGITAHPDLDANVLPGYDFVTDLTMAGDGNARDSDASDPGDFVTADQCGAGSPAENSSWHGTHVAGTVAAVTNNAEGGAGVAPLAKIVPVRVLGRCGGYTSDIADAIIWASGGTVASIPVNPNPAEVINMSLGGGGACDPVSQAAINLANNRGTTVVVAAGNSNSSVLGFNPASCNKVITVASNDQSGIRSGFSNAGLGTDVSAGGGSGGPGPGLGVLSTWNGGTTTPGAAAYGLMQGTSMASPHVAGVVALMQSVSPHTPAEVEAMLKLTAAPMLGATCPGTCGAGKVDALRAVQAAGGTVFPAPKGVLRNAIKTLVPDGTLGSVYRYTLTTYSDLTNLQFDLLNGTGNADLYVRLGAPPTTSVYDCRSKIGTSNETCVIPSAATGVWHVMVRGAAPYSGVNVRGMYNTRLFTNKTDVPVPDSNSTFSASPVWVHGRVGNAPPNMRVSVKVYHTYIGDLELQLVAPDGTIYPLQGTSGDSSDSIVTDFYVNASAEVANGNWRLEVRDLYGADTGHIDEWTLRM